MQGAGNDLVLVDGRDGLRADWPELARRMCERHLGVGSDGLLVVRPSDRADFRMDMWNPDGSSAEMCGNGIRCFAKYLLDGAAAGRQDLTVETGAGVLTVRARGSSDWLQVSMGRPILNGRDIPVDSDDNPVLHLPLPDLGFDVTCLSMGNPHAVRFVSNVDAVDLERLGPLVEHHRLFPRRINFHLCQVVSRGELKMRTWERGAGLTLACGTGACATAVAARLRELTDSVTTVHVPGGRLELEWDGQGEVYMTGPAAYVFRGEWIEG